MLYGSTWVYMHHHCHQMVTQACYFSPVIISKHLSACADVSPENFLNCDSHHYHLQVFPKVQNLEENIVYSVHVYFWQCTGCRHNCDLAFWLSKSENSYKLRNKGGGDFARGFFRTRKFRTEFISHSDLKIPREISHPSRIVLFTGGSCTAKFQRVPGLFCEFPRASRWAFFIFRGFLHDLDLNPMPQTHLPFGCCAATNMWTKIFTP